MQAVGQLLPLATSAHGYGQFNYNLLSAVSRCCSYFSVAAPRQEGSATVVSSTQLQLLNQLGILPSVARYWDSGAIDAELRNVDASDCAELETTQGAGPTAVQKLLAQRYGVSLGTCRKQAATNLAAAAPPPTRTLAVLYGVLDYQGDVPASAAAARQLLKRLAQALPHAHALDCDLAPVAMSQMSELYVRLGFIGRQPFSYAAAQLMAGCMRTILADVDDEARLRPLPSMDSRQADLIRYLRSRRAPPGTRGMPAVQDVDLTARGGVSRLAAARNILQLLQNHQLSASPQGEPVELLRSLGHSGPVPPSTGEALMLAAELRDRCLPPRPAHLAALRAAGYGAAGGPAAPRPESVAHVRAVLRVLRRADTEAATPATRAALAHLADLRRRPLAAPHAAAAAAAAAAAGPWAAAPSSSGGGGGGGHGGPVGRVGGGVAGGMMQRPGPCPSQLEVRAAIEDLPLSEQLMEDLFELGWPGPMPATHGAALALKDFLLHQKAAAAAASTAAAAANIIATVPLTPPSTPSPSAFSSPLAPGSGGGGGGGSGGSGGSPGGAPHRRAASHHQHQHHHHHQHNNGGGGGGSNPYDPFSRHHHQHHLQQQLIARIGSTPEEALTKIQIRGMFPGAVSEWYLPTMCREEAEHVLACLLAARRAVLERAAGEGYDEYVERWEAAEAQGDWWGMEWLWS